VKFLIDECLTVELVDVAGGAGYEAHHVAHVGRAGWKDWNVVRYAREHDFTLVTNNAADFRTSRTHEVLSASAAICRGLVDPASRRVRSRAPETRLTGPDAAGSHDGSGRSEREHFPQYLGAFLGDRE
jgi:hypothetical protein